MAVRMRRAGCWRRARGDRQHDVHCEMEGADGMAEWNVDRAGQKTRDTQRESHKEAKKIKSDQVIRHLERNNEPRNLPLRCAGWNFETRALFTVPPRLS